MKTKLLHLQMHHADDTEENTGYKTVQANRGTSKLRSCAQRVLLRQAPGSFCTNSQLLQVIIDYNTAVVDHTFRGFITGP